MKLSAYGYMHLCDQCTNYHGASCYHPASAFESGLCVIRNRRAELVPDVLTQMTTEPACSTDPDAPHGFNRSASHAEGRYVCDCEVWVP